MCAKNSVHLLYLNNGIHIEHGINNSKHYQVQINILERIIKSQEEEIVFLRKIIELNPKPLGNPKFRK